MILKDLRETTDSRRPLLNVLITPMIHQPKNATSSNPADGKGERWINHRTQGYLESCLLLVNTAALGIVKKLECGHTGAATHRT